MEEFKKNDEDDFEDEDFLAPKHQEHHEHQSHHSEKGAAQEHKPIHHEHHQKPKSKTKYNFWQIVSAVLAVILLITLYFGSFSNGGISKEDAADQTLNFVNTKLLQGQTTATLVSVEEKGELYNVKLSVNGQMVDGYVTKDGELFFPQAIDMSATAGLAAAADEPAQPAQELPKTAKPKVELFVMSHCPYGTQAEKAMIPVVQELGDKIDFSIKFVNYAMHGEKEVLEQMNQVCIEKEQNTKFLDYLNCFLKEGEGETCLTETKIDNTKLSSCVQKLDTEFNIRKSLEDESTWSGGRFPPFLVHDKENEEYGVQGSPTLVINGEQASASRSPAAFLAAVCGAFSEVPEECGAELSSAQASPGFGSGTASTAAANGCVQ